MAGERGVPLPATCGPVRGQTPVGGLLWPGLLVPGGGVVLTEVSVGFARTGVRTATGRGRIHPPCPRSLGRAPGPVRGTGRGGEAAAQRSGPAPGLLVPGKGRGSGPRSGAGSHVTGGATSHHARGAPTREGTHRGPHGCEPHPTRPTHKTAGQGLGRSIPMASGGGDYRWCYYLCRHDCLMYCYMGVPV